MSIPAKLSEHYHFLSIRTPLLIAPPPPPPHTHPPPPPPWPLPRILEEWRFGFINVKKWRIGSEHRRRSEDWEFEDVKITKKWSLSVKKGFLNVKMVKLGHRGIELNWIRFLLSFYFWGAWSHKPGWSFIWIIGIIIEKLYLLNLLRSKWSYLRYASQSQVKPLWKTCQVHVI